MSDGLMQIKMPSSHIFGTFPHRNSFARTFHPLAWLFQLKKWLLPASKVETPIFTHTHTHTHFPGGFLKCTLWTDFTLKNYIVTFAPFFYCINFIISLLHKQEKHDFSTLNFCHMKKGSTGTHSLLHYSHQNQRALTIGKLNFCCCCLIKHLCWLSRNTSQNLQCFFHTLEWQTYLKSEMFPNSELHF